MEDKKNAEEGAPEDIDPFFDNEEIIELTDPIAPYDDEVKEQAGEEEDDVDGIIDLIDAVTEDDDIIELFDVAADDDEDIIELLDMAEDEPSGREAVIELTDVVEFPAGDAGMTPADDSSEVLDRLLEEALELNRPGEPAEDIGSVDEDDLTEALGIELSDDFHPGDYTARPGAEVPGETQQAPDAPHSHAADDTEPLPAVSTEQLEAAVERVILKLFSEKIEKLMVDAVEKAVTREIDNLRDVLLKDFVENTDKSA